MPKLRNKKTGAVIERYGDTAVELVRSGEYEPVDGTLEVQGKAGTRFDVTPEQLAAERSYAAPDPVRRAAEAEQAYQESLYDKPEYKMGAFGHAGLDMLTGGLSGFFTPDDMKKAMEHNRGYTIAGSVAGLIPGLFTGGAEAGIVSKIPTVPGLLARGSAAIRGGKAATIATKIAAEAFEGAGYGVAQGISNVAYADPDLSAEAALGEIIKQGVFGGALGAGAGVLGAGFEKLSAARKAKGVDVFDMSVEGHAKAEAVSGIVNELDTTMVDLGAKAETATLGGKWYKSESFGRARKQTARSWQQFQDEAADTARALRARANNKALIKKDPFAAGEAARLANAIESSMRSFGRADDLIEAAGRTGSTEVMANVRGTATLINEGRDILKRRQLRVGLLDRIEEPLEKYSMRAPANADTYAHDAFAAAKEHRAALAEIVGDGPIDIEKLAKLEGDKGVEALVHLNNYMDAAATAAGRHMEVKDLLNKYKGAMKELGTDIAGGGSLMATMAAFGVSQEYLPNFEGPVDDVAKLWLAHKMLGPKTMGGTKSGGGGGGLIAKMARGGIIGGTARGVYDYTAKAGAPRIARAGAAAAGAHVGNSIADLVLNVANKTSSVSNTIGSLVGKAGKKITKVAPVATLKLMQDHPFGAEEKPPANLKEAYRVRMDQLATIAAGELGAQQQVNDALTGLRLANSMLGDRVEMAAMRAASYLFRVAPKDPGTMVILGESQWTPTKSEMEVWGRHWRGVMDPEGVLKRAWAGGITPQEAEAVRAVHPRIFQQFTQQLAANLPELRKTLKYAERIRLGVLTGVPLDPLTRPGFLQMMQDNYDMQATNNQAKTAPKGAMNPEPPSPAQAMLR